MMIWLFSDWQQAPQTATLLMVGLTDTDGYEFDESKAVVNGKFVGLTLDEDNQSDLTEKRLKSWIERLKNGFS